MGPDPPLLSPVRCWSTPKWNHATNIMTIGWHMVMGLEPSHRLLLWDETTASRCSEGARICHQHPDGGHRGEGRGNRRFVGPRRRRIQEVQVDGCTRQEGQGPADIGKCCANFECRLLRFRPHQQVQASLFNLGRLLRRTRRPSPRYPRTLHYRGDGIFHAVGWQYRQYRRLFSIQI